MHPARVYGELRRVLDRDAVVTGDGGDFVSFAGKLVDSYTPGRWLDPGPYGCLGTGMGYAAAARLAPSEAQVCVLLGDGAAGSGPMDVDTLVRHRLPVVMIVGNNGIWALEKHPMRQLYDGWDVAADLQPETAYDKVVEALGGAGETVGKPADLGPALRRTFDAGVPYLVNVITDPSVVYPRVDDPGLTHRRSQGRRACLGQVRSARYTFGVTDGELNAGQNVYTRPPLDGVAARIA